MNYRAKRDKLIGLFFGIIILGGFLAIYLLFQNFSATTIPVTFLISIVIGLLLWIWFDTIYKITDQFFYYRSGPFIGKIEIKKISKIITDKTLLVGMKPALARNGLIIRYNKWDELYIAPKEKKSFIGQILLFNPNIEVKN